LLGEGRAIAQPDLPHIPGIVGVWVWVWAGKQSEAEAVRCFRRDVDGTERDDRAKETRLRRIPSRAHKGFHAEGPECQLGGVRHLDVAAVYIHRKALWQRSALWPRGLEKAGFL
jgi:hypothetical protein